MAHTPDKWRLWPTHWAGSSSSLEYRLVVADKDVKEIICYMGHAPHVPPTEQQWDNARLIAAAPDLLTALESVE